MHKQKSSRRRVNLGQAIVLMVLFAMLLFAIVWSMMAWTSAEDAEMSIHGWIALALGTIFSLVIGCGLMALMFYSSRSGYDDTANTNWRSDKSPPDD
jgi:protein-S-isoprenylcysteine O-methyltransferase Ste14